METTHPAPASLPGFRTDRADWTVFAGDAPEGTGPHFRICFCSCGGRYLRAMGVAGRPREHCSNVCKDLRPALNAFAVLVDAYAAKCAANGGDSVLLHLKAELMSLTQHSAMQAATGRRGQAALKARRAAAAAAMAAK